MAKSSILAITNFGSFGNSLMVFAFHRQSSLNPALLAF